MKKVGYLALAAALAMATGCTKKNDDGTTELMSTEEVAEKAQETAVEVVEKTEETVVAVAEKAEEVTAKAEEVTQAVSEKTQEAVTSLTVKAEDVMGDLNQSVEQIKEKVAAFDKTQVLGYVTQYKDVILEKKDQVAALTEKVKSLSIMELAGEKGLELKTQLSQHTEQFKALKDRYTVYYNKLAEFGVDMTAFGLE